MNTHQRPAIAREVEEGKIPVLSVTLLRKKIAGDLPAAGNLTPTH
jgi:hypothetical protein